MQLSVISPGKNAFVSLDFVAKGDRLKNPKLLSETHFLFRIKKVGVIASIDKKRRVKGGRERKKQMPLPSYESEK